MSGTPSSNPSSMPDSFVSIGDEVQAELDRRTAYLRATGLTANVSTSETQYALEAGALAGVFFGPFVYILLTLLCQHFFAPELLGDGQYKFLLLGSLPYALMWGGYLGARLPLALSAAGWRSMNAWVGLIACLGAIVLMAHISPVARLYMPLYALPFVSIVWAELAARHSD